MKVETLLEFNYTNAATTYYTRATFYSEMVTTEDFCMVTTITTGNDSRIKYDSRSEGVQACEKQIAVFLELMHLIYKVE